jgi:hypothetical protein
MEPLISRRSTFNRALADFAAKAHELSKKAVDGRSYVLVEELMQWMRGMSLSKLDNKFVTNTDLLAHAAYFGRHDFPPIVSSHISDAGPDCCVVVFGILLDLELGHLINLFSKKGIVDSQLPQDLSSLKRKLASLQPGERVAERFNERQWKFCPATFSLNMEKEYFEDRIIPICRQAHLSSGGTARVSQIVVQSEFVDKKLRNLLAGDEHASYIDRDHGPVSRPAPPSGIVTAVLAREAGLGSLIGVLHTVLSLCAQDFQGRLLSTLPRRKSGFRWPSRKPRRHTLPRLLQPSIALALCSH